MSCVYNELNAYTYKKNYVLTSGKIQFTHPTGLHDDCISEGMSLMLANQAREKFGNTGGGLYVGGSIPRNQMLR